MRSFPAARSGRTGLAVAGLLLAVGTGSGPGPAPAAASPRPVTPSAVLLPEPVDGPPPVAGPEPARPAAIPLAAVDQGASAEPSFRPLELAFPDGGTAPVLTAGVRPDGSLVIPDDPATVGWWDGGARPGEPFGSVVVAGHVDSAEYGLGAMSRLKRLRPGDLVELRGGPGPGTGRQRYRIAARTRIAQPDLAVRGDIFRQDVAARLVLITCGGAFDPVSRHYRSNLVVFADPVGR